MKKHLIAAAVAAAVAVPAMAQVTISGTIDQSYNFGSANADKFVAGVMSTPDLKMSGSEDLGGGVKAFFDINTGMGGVWGNDFVAPANATASATNTNGGATIVFGDRGNRVGLSGGFGSIAFGKTTGTAINGLRGGVAGNRSLLNDGGFNEDGDRPTNVVDYTSPEFGGVTARVIYQLTSKDYEVSAAYRAGPLSAGLAFAKHVGFNSKPAGNNTAAQVSYNFGIASANFSYQKIGASTASTSSGGVLSAGGNAALAGTNMSLGVSVPMGASTLFAEFQDRADVQKRINVGAVHNLSKRTNAYAIYSDNSNATGSIANINDAIIAVGVRHSF